VKQCCCNQDAFGLGEEQPMNLVLRRKRAEDGLEGLQKQVSERSS